MAGICVFDNVLAQFALDLMLQISGKSRVHLRIYVAFNLMSHQLGVGKKLNFLCKELFIYVF